MSEQESEHCLTADEYEAVRAAVIVGAGQKTFGQPYTLNSLFAAWASVVEDLEDGFSSTTEWDFKNDLRCREILSRAWPLLPDRVREIRRSELNELDERFRASTVQQSGRPEAGGDWWRWRIPRWFVSSDDE